MTKVLVFGTFDGIHEGHLDFFRQAKKYGDYLVVVVGRDVTVEKVKNRKPLKNETERMGDLQKQDLVDQVLLGNVDDPYKIIAEIKPDVICLGYDQKSFTGSLQKALDNLNFKTQVVRLKAFKPEKYHSSGLNER